MITLGIVTNYFPESSEQKGTRPMHWLAKLIGGIISFLIPIVAGFAVFAYLSKEVSGASIFPHIRDNITPMIPAVGGIVVGVFLAGICWRRRK